MKVFLDTNVLLDVLLKRIPHYIESGSIWTLAESRKIDGVVSALSYPNSAYVLRAQGRQRIRDAIVLLQGVFRCIPLDEDILRHAFEYDMVDYEDAIQYASAIRAGADCLITRNARHFPVQDVLILSPAEFLARRLWE